MRTEDSLFILLAIVVGIPVALWIYQAEIFGFLQTVDLMILQVFSALPWVGDYYGQYQQAYGELHPEQLRFQHTWIVSTVVWRPIVFLFMGPLCLRWAWKAYKTRRAQAFNNMTKGFLDKHLKSTQTVQGESRQQWTVRRWFHFYKLHAMKWGSAQWHRRINLAFQKQIGPEISDPEGQALIKEFCEFLHREAIKQFGAKSARLLPPGKLAKECIKQHQYVSTAMVRAVAASRDQFGVLSPNGFRNRLFQKSDTVPIWFALNGFGRQTTHIESQGILSHFYEEITKGEPIRELKLDNALEGLEQYRIHHVERRKLADLDETKRIEAEEKRKAKAEEVHKPKEPAAERYKESGQLLT